MEKTLLINCSPKKKLSVSGFIMRCAGLMIRGEKEYLCLRTPADRERILQAMVTSGKVVFVLPLYVDGVPSHVLSFLKEAEAFCGEKGLRMKVYAIANNGFIEGRQNEPLMQVMENFCARSGLEWCGGVGIGGGVMLNVERIMMPVMFGLTLVNMLLNAVQRRTAAPLLRDHFFHRPSGGAYRQGYERGETVYARHAAVLRFHPFCGYLLYDHFRFSGRNLPRMVLKTQTGR